MFVGAMLGGADTAAADTGTGVDVEAEVNGWC